MPTAAKKTVTTMKKPTPQAIINKRSSATETDSRGLRVTVYPTPDVMERMNKARNIRPGLPMSYNQWVLVAILDKLEAMSL